ncbi:hypothetical protein PVAP13_3KG109500 [Panicum virgatum]|uniref:Uncharacterized protein n=2 Tax=Panicum virgatum TaxID=38727 RepID=A0A8T0UVN3_PANVG|nr:hypothetical protein PVAP13_3KG109500 [Panicum virgatum]
MFMDDRGGRRRGRRRRRQQGQRAIDVAAGNSAEEVDGDIPGSRTPKKHTWKAIMGLPMTQTVPDTCGLVAATVCLEAQHRLEFEREHGSGSFPCRAAAPRMLRRECYRQQIWNPYTQEYDRGWAPRKGARINNILAKIKEIGGVRTTNAAPPAPLLLPLADYEIHKYTDLNPATAAELIYRRGPCIGTIFATEAYCSFVDANQDPSAVFKGCPRAKRIKLWEKNKGAFHFVVCYEYRHIRGQLHILVMDNQSQGATRKWIDFTEFDALHTIRVDPLPPRHLVQGPSRSAPTPPVYF